MTVLTELLASLQGDAPLRRRELGPRCAALWSRRVGLASVPEGAAATARVELPETASARAVAQRARASDPVEAALGVAALNSLLCPASERLQTRNGYEVILELGAGRDVTVVGHFPFVERLRAAVRRLWVLELSPREGDLPASEAPRVIPLSDVLVISAATLVNHTLDGLLALARGGPRVLLLGPTTPLSPVLFDHGVAVLGGAVVIEPDRVLDQVRDGVPLRHMPGTLPVVWSRGRG